MDKLYKGRKGFTYLESIVALIVFIGITILPMNNYINLKESFENTFFINEFKSKWIECRLNSILDKEKTSVLFSSIENEIIFKHKDEVLNMKLPNKLKLKTNRTIYINKDGTVKPETVIFKSLINNHDYTFKIQMEWGMLNET